MISREDLVEQSVFDYARDALRGRGYSEAQVEMRESFPAARGRLRAQHRRRRGQLRRRRRRPAG